MGERAHFTADEARAAGERIGIDWAISRFDVEQFRMGMDVELEHGTHDPETNVTDDDVSVTAKIARAHLNDSLTITPALQSWRRRRRPTGPDRTKRAHLERVSVVIAPGSVHTRRASRSGRSPQRLLLAGKLKLHRDA